MWLLYNMCHNPERQQQSHPLVCGEYLNHGMKITVHGVEKLKPHLSSAPRFCECDHLIRQLSVHINAGSKAIGRGNKAFKKFSYWEIGNGIWDRHSLRRGNRHRQLSVKSMCSWMKTGTKLSLPGRTALDGTLDWWQLQGQQRHATAAPQKHLVPVHSCRRTFVLLCFVLFWVFKADFYKQIFRFSLPNRRTEWEQMWYSWVWWWKKNLTMV